MNTSCFLQFAALAVALSAHAALSPTELMDGLVKSDTSYKVVDRGQNFAVLQRTAPSADGNSPLAHQFTLLENGLHYLSNGEWKLSQDLIEPFPQGAVAQYGPTRTVFSPELRAEAVFDIQTPEGQRIRGGVRAIQLTDSKTGRSLVLGTVKEGVLGEVIPPAQVVYRSGFDGLDADVLFVWRHNSISQNVVLKKRPVLPADMDPSTTRLEVVTELVESPKPLLNTTVLTSIGKPDIPDDTTIGLGSLLAVRGQAFPLSGGEALMLTGAHLADGTGVPVIKQFQQLEDGRMFVVESVSWEEIQPLLKGLSTAKNDAPAAPKDRTTSARIWPRAFSKPLRAMPMQVATGPYQSAGFLVDIEFLNASASTYTFLSGSTYYIAQSFYIAPSTITFQPGCVIKYGNDAWLLMHGPISCPPTGQMMPVVTSKDDDLFGAMIADSTHNPTYMANRALWVYYVSELVTDIKNMRVRWAKKGIGYDASGGGVDNLSDALFQQCQTGVYATMPSRALTLTNARKCNVTTPVFCDCDGLSGVMADDCSAVYQAAAFPGKAREAGFPDVPDVMGAVGPSNYVAILNSGAGVAVYDRNTGSIVAQCTLEQFFATTAHGVTYPRFSMCDPQILFDHQSQRWFASAMECTGFCSSNELFVAVSNDANPVGSSPSNFQNNHWTKIVLGVETYGVFFDAPKLGVDSHGVYVVASAAQITTPCSGGTILPPKLVAIWKDDLISGNSIIHQMDCPYTGEKVLPALNFDALAGSDSTWFLCNDAVGVAFVRLTWNVSSKQPSLQNANWPTVQTPPRGSPPGIPSQGTSVLWTSGAGTQLRDVVIRNGALWTSRSIGVNSQGGSDSPTRRAIEWLRFNVGTEALSYAEHGVLFDPTSVPRHYDNSSLMVNSRGDALIGFSGSSQSEYIGAFYWARLTDSSTIGPSVFKAGEHVWNLPRWGDYSRTSLDPNDGLTFWTVQEYAHSTVFPPPSPTWGTWICAFAPR